MEAVQTDVPELTQKPAILRDGMNNEVSSTSSDENSPLPRNTSSSSKENSPLPRNNTDTFNNFYKTNYVESHASDSEAPVRPQRKQTNKMAVRNHHKSMGNINDTILNEVDNNLNIVQNSISNLSIKKYQKLQIPIIGYEVMEERARFTIFKLKVEDDKSDQSWLVFRRYTDFVRLFTRIKTEQPSLVLPLPGKRWFRDNYDPAFLQDRVRGLQIFVNAILLKLPNHPVVREFFCLDEPPQVYYQPEVQAVYGALEDSVATMQMQLKQKDATLAHMQKRLAQLEAQVRGCANCSAKLGL